MRGENAVARMKFPKALETSPHAWRKLFNVGVDLIKGRNISTCVEKTYALCHHARQVWKHLHMRGENPKTIGNKPLGLETSPHAWRKLLRAHMSLRFSKKHLHMRGENHKYCKLARSWWETSPHAWRKH